MDAIFSRFSGDSPLLQSIGKWGFVVYDNRELILMYIHLILAAVFPIYIGSHASLRRPPSAALPQRRLGADGKAVDEDGDQEEDVQIEGLTPSDAVMFPVIAAITLGTLYLIIKWLEDPKLLNKLLNVYFSGTYIRSREVWGFDCQRWSTGLGIFGVGKLAADGLNVLTSFYFPSVWSSSTETYYVEPLLCQQVVGPVNKARVLVHRKFVDKTNPFPGLLSRVQFPASLNKRLWSLRAALTNHWVFRGYLRGKFNFHTILFHYM